MTIADTTTRLSESIKDRHPEIPWEEVRGFRNVAVHAYDQIQLRQVARIVDRDLPALQRVVEKELEALRQRERSDNRESGRGHER